MSRWLYSLTGVALLCGIVWWVGPLLWWLEDWPPRASIAVTLLIIWAAANLLIEVRHEATEQALTTGLAEDPAAAADGEKTAIEAKLTAALALLRRTRGTRGYLYEQPWYAIIGPPGAGKTTALLHAGLSFPLAAAMGPGAIAGVGGTRRCDWWLAEQAVMIDTAGRYTTQESDAAIDRAGWEAFLELLRRTRPRRPLNGVIVAVALSDIAQGTAAERAAHARAIRQRIAELDDRLGLRLPIYAVLTKADLLSGFTEFFDDLDGDGRSQVWGTTFPADAVVPPAITTWFRPLVERLGDRLIDRLRVERNPERRALLVGFPSQVASLESPLGEFLTGAFGAAGSAPPPLLRGVYLTSAVQEGTPIDRLTGTIARVFGLSQPRMARLQPRQGRSYFLARLLHDVIFKEAMLVSGGAARRRRFRLVTAAAMAAAALLVGTAGAVLWPAYQEGQLAIASAAAALAKYEQAATGLPLDPVAEADLASVLPLLEQARSPLDRVLAEPVAASTAWRSLLSQEGKLATGQRGLYRHALERVLLPRLIWRLDAQLRGNMANPEFLYEATRIYLMLGTRGPLDRDLVRAWMALDWQVGWPGPANAALRAALARHLDALLADPLPDVLLDGDLVTQARATFGRVSLAQRIYSRIRASAAAQALPPWRPSDTLGPAGAVVFVRASGRRLDDGIPGFYTVDGFHNVLLPAFPHAAQDIAQESWVLGRTVPLDPQGEQMRAVERDVVLLYEADYARAWDGMLGDLNLAPLRSLIQAAQDLYIVASDHSPMRALLVSAARQLTLSVPPHARPGAGVAAASAIGDTAARLQRLLGATPAAAAAAAPGHEIDERYAALRELVGSGAGGPIDQAMKPLIDLQQQLARLAAAGVRGGAPATGGFDDPALALRAEADRQPQPLSRWLATAAASGVALRGGDPRQQVIAAYNNPNGPAAQCATAISGRYPFTPGAAGETSLEEFARVFGPGGMLDGFVNTLLKPYIDTNGRVWKAASPDGSPPPLGTADLAQFQRAAQIRDLFFATGRASPAFRFDIAPVRLDARTSRVRLDLEGTPLSYSTGTPRATEINWPGAGQPGVARLSVEPPPVGANGIWEETGNWALFRLLERGRLVPGAGPDRLLLTFQMAERQAIFEVRTGSHNLTATSVLQAFRCPVVQ